MLNRFSCTRPGLSREYTSHALRFRPSWPSLCFMPSLLLVHISLVQSGCSRTCYAGRRCLEQRVHFFSYFSFPESKPNEVLRREASSNCSFWISGSGCVCRRGSLQRGLCPTVPSTTPCLKPVISTRQVCDGRGCIFYRIFCCPFVMTLGGNAHPSVIPSPNVPNYCSNQFLAPPPQLAAKDIQRYTHLLLCVLPQLCLLPVHAFLYKGLLLG